MHALYEAFDLLSRIGSRDIRAKETVIDDGMLLEKGFFANLFHHTVKKSLGSKHESNVFYHPTYKMFAGTVNGVAITPATEKQFYKALITKHQFEPHNASDFIDNIKSGTPSGFSHMTAEA